MLPGARSPLYVVAADCQEIRMTNLRNDAPVSTETPNRQGYRKAKNFGEWSWAGAVSGEERHPPCIAWDSGGKWLGKYLRICDSGSSRPAYSLNPTVSKRGAVAVCGTSRRSDEIFRLSSVPELRLCSGCLLRSLRCRVRQKSRHRACPGGSRLCAMRRLRISGSAPAREPPRQAGWRLSDTSSVAFCCKPLLDVRSQ